MNSPNSDAGFCHSRDMLSRTNFGCLIFFSTDATKLSTVTNLMFLKTSILASLETKYYNIVLSTQFTYNGFEKCKKNATSVITTLYHLSRLPVCFRVWTSVITTLSPFTVICVFQGMDSIGDHYSISFHVYLCVSGYGQYR